MKRVRRTKEEAMRLILDAAEQLVTQSGPDAMRVADVAKGAGMKEANVFHHFGSREKVLQAVVRRAIQRGAKRAVLAFGEALGADPKQRAEALATVFDVIQQEGVGRLYGWLILSGRMSDATPPEFSPLLNAIRAWRAATFGDGLAHQSDDEARYLLLLIAIIWMGEAIGGDLLPYAVGFADHQEARHGFRRWIARLIIAALELEAEGRGSARATSPA